MYIIKNERTIGIYKQMYIKTLSINNLKLKTDTLIHGAILLRPLALVISHSIGLFIVHFNFIRNTYRAHFVR